MRLVISTCWVLMFMWTNVMVGQVQNDICSFAEHIDDVDNYCSEVAEFSNVGATANIPINNPCFLNFTGTVWFSFVPKEPAAIIRVNPTTLSQTEIGVYRGNCNDLELVGCTSSAGGLGTVQLTVTDLVIGQIYYLTVDGAEGQQGSFQLCIDDFIDTKPPEADCAEAVILCDTSPFYVESLIGTGVNQNELEDNDCIGEEFASVWYKWTCEESGTLEFTLTPNNFIPGMESDDLDFSVYRLNNGLDDCNNKSLLRCVASGANGFNNVTDPFETWQECNGPTGLLASDNDLSEQPGCQNGDNNFARPIDMVAGESYALIVNNYSQSGLGFSIEFGGTGTFLGPQVDFDIQALEEFECDKTIEFINLSNSETDPIVSYQWNFGNGASPVFSNGEGPHDVIYDSFGEKTVALTVTSTKGCSVTKIYDLDVAACCADTSTLMADAEAFDLICFDIPEGMIIAQGISGAPAYNYSIDGISFQPNPRFIDCVTCLDPFVVPFGQTTYQLLVTDDNGCTDVDEVTVRVNIERPVHAPNIFSPNNDGNNEFFNLFAGPGASRIDNLYIFDRWGNRVYRGQNVMLNEYNEGWDGNYKGAPVNPGVFTWIAEVRFIDDEVFSYTGDITVMR